jgi:hypothetical protein
MCRALLAIVSVVVVGLIASAEALAVPPICDPVEDPDCGGGGGSTIEVTHTLSVSKAQGGTIVSSDGTINCGTDCEQSQTYTQECEFNECGEPEPALRQFTLTASGGPAGFAPSWAVTNDGSSSPYGCDSTTANSCTVTLDADKTVALTWNDVTDPATTLPSSNPTKVGPTVKTFTASASDNASVSRVRFSVDGVLAGDDTTPGDGFSQAINLTAYSHGSAHTVTAQAFDTSGRSDPTPASANFTVDRETSVVVSDVPSATNAVTVPVQLTLPADATAVCNVNAGPDSPCAGSFEPPLPSEGSYTYEVTATDDVGNVAVVTRTFEVDRTAPVLDIDAPRKPLNGKQLSLELQSSEALDDVKLSAKRSDPMHVAVSPGSNELEMTLSRATRRWVKQQINRNGKAKLSVKASSADAAGNPDEDKAKITIR